MSFDNLKEPVRKTIIDLVLSSKDTILPFLYVVRSNDETLGLSIQFRSGGLKEFYKSLTNQEFSNLENEGYITFIKEDQDGWSKNNYLLYKLSDKANEEFDKLETEIAESKSLKLQINNPKLNEHEKRILIGLVKFYDEKGYKSETYNNPETGGIYEHKLAHKLGYETPNNMPPQEFLAAAELLAHLGFVRRMQRTPDYPVLGIWPTPEGRLYVRSIQEDEKSDQANVKIQNDKIFVVHGHNEEIKEKVARFLESIDLSPLILHEHAGQSRTIIEKVEEYSDVGYAVILMTSDDVGRKKNEEGDMPRARQNVVLELGFFIGKIGRKNVVALYEAGVEIPSDFKGVEYIPLENDTEWKVRLARELQAAGFQVDLNKIK